MDDIELRLRKFRPRQPAPLPAVFRLRRSRKPLWIGAAAALAAAVLVAVSLQSPTPPPREESTDRVTLAELTRLAIESPDEFDATLTQMSRTMLPDVEQKGGALEQLATTP